MNWIERSARVLSFNVIQTIGSKLIGAIQLAILLRVLPLSEIGAIGLAAGYVGLLAVLLISPETVFVRDFAKFSGKLNQTISAFLLFGGFRTLVLMAAGIPVAIWLFLTQGRMDVALYFVVTLLAAALNVLTSPMREALYAQYRQARITAVDLVLNGASLGLMIFLFFYPTLLTYGMIQLVVSIVGLGWWYYNSKKYLNFQFAVIDDWWAVSMHALSSFSVWNHLQANSLRIVYQADVIILSFFVGLTDLGAYSVALTIANLFFVIPQYVQKITTLSLSGDQPLERLHKGFGLAVKYNSLLTILQWAAWAAGGTLVLWLLGVKQVEEVGVYALLLVTGTSIFNLARPWMAFLIAQYDARKLFMELFLYPGAIALLVYAYAASTYGLIGVAWANVGVYGIIALLIVGFTGAKLHMFPRLRPLVGAEERAFFLTLLKRKPAAKK